MWVNGLETAPNLLYVFFLRVFTRSLFNQNESRIQTKINQTMAMAEPKDLIGSGHRILRWQPLKSCTNKTLQEMQNNFEWMKMVKQRFFHTIDLESSNCQNEFWKWIFRLPRISTKLKCSVAENRVDALRLVFWGKGGLGQKLDLGPLGPLGPEMTRS